MKKTVKPDRRVRFRAGAEKPQPEAKPATPRKRTRKREEKKS